MALDLSAAFDTVDHHVLLSILENEFGVYSTALEWIKNYLSPRSCVVKINESCSASRDLPFSVPQGPVAGPTFYWTYASPLKEVVAKHKVDINGFADDHALLKTWLSGCIAAERAVIIKLEVCLTDVKNWMGSCRLKMNCEKTEFIVFAPSRQIHKCISKEIEVAGQKVTRVPQIKYLGTFLDAGLTLKFHISQKSVRKYLTEDACKTIMSGLVLSHIDYANALFTGLPKCDIDKLQRVQNFAARIVKGLNKYTSVRSELRQLHWLPVQQRIDHKVASLVYKCLHGQAPPYLSNMLVKKETSNWDLQSNSDDLRLIIPITKCKTFADRSFSVYGPRLWNSLPYDIRASNNLDSFKKNLNTYLFDM